MIKIKRLTNEQLILFFYVTISVITSLFFQNKYIAIAIGVIETFILFFCAIFKTTDKTILYLLFFQSTVIENSLFALGTKDVKIYHVASLPLVRVYHILFLIILLLVKSLPCNKWDKIKFSLKEKHIRYIILWICAFCVSVITFFLDDNKVRSVWGLTRYIIVDAYNTLWLVGVFAIVYKNLSIKEKFKKQLEILFVGILKGSTISAVILVLLGNVRILENGESMYLICPLIFYWAPALLLFYIKEKKISYVIYGIIAIILQIKYTVGIPGTWWITTGVISLVFVLKIFLNIPSAKKFGQSFGVVLFIGCIGVLFTVLLFAGEIAGSNNYVMYKLSTVKKIFLFTSDASVWLYNLGKSVGTRVEEFINVIIEYINKPMYLFTGKGFGGTIQHYWGVFSWDYENAFTEVQRINGSYSNFHTGAVEMMINFGISGFFFVVRWIFELIGAAKEKKENPWIIIGTLYMLLFFSCYWSMVICIAMMSYGVYLNDSKEI